MKEKSIAAQLRSLLEQDPDSINAIAKASGISQPVLYRFYVGERDIKLSTVEKLFKYFDLTIERRG